jgi:hypothetical protein
VRAMNRLALIVVIAWSSLSLADVPPPNSQGCLNKNAGDACTDDSNVARTCVAQTCTRLDYSRGTPPTSMTYACNLCQATDGGTSPIADAGTGTTPQKTGCTAVPGGVLAALALFFALRTRR